MTPAIVHARSLMPVLNLNRWDVVSLEFITHDCPETIAPSRITYRNGVVRCMPFTSIEVRHAIGEISRKPRSCLHQKRRISTRIWTYRVP